jgi:hypothetical protein
MTEEENESIKKLISTKDITNIKLAYLLGKDSNIINEYKKAIYFYKPFLHLFDNRRRRNRYNIKKFTTVEEIIFFIVNLKMLRLNKSTIIREAPWMYTGRLKRLPYLHLFLNLRIIHACDHEIKKIDVSNNPLLIDISLGNNRLTEINISKNLKLEHLNIKNNNITSLDTNNNKKLRSIYADLLCT